VGEVWTNWAGDQHCAPHRIEEPASEAELAEAVGRAAVEGLPLRVAGSGHSFTDIVCTDGVLLRLRRMKRVLEADPESGLVRVEGGITLAELGPELARRGLALENLGDVDFQGVAGAVSTGTHGTGIRFRNVSSQVAEMRLVTAEGKTVDLSDDSHPEALQAARVGLGSLGVIASLTLRCVPLYTLQRVDEPRPLEETLGRLDDLVDGSDHFELFTFPYTDVALTRTTRRVDRPAEPRSRRVRFQEVVENRVLELACRSGRAAPSQVPRINRTLMGLADRSEKTDLSYLVYANRRDVRFTEMEYAIPRAAAAVAVERVMGMVERRRLPITFPIELRFVAPDDAFLSTAHGRETAYVAVHTYRGNEFESYFRAVEAIMNDYGGRPHWGKRHYQTAATLHPRYPDWDRFQAVRERLDPGGLFRNDYTDRVLGPVHAPVAAI
jgi:FAD-linked oxidoreductase